MRKLYLNWMIFLIILEKLENNMNLNLEEINNKSEIQNIDHSKKEQSKKLENKEENTLGKLVISEDTQRNIK